MDRMDMMECRMFHPTNGRNNFDNFTEPWMGELPLPEIVASMLVREKELRLSDENQEAYACPGPSTQVTEWIQIRVCREFGFPDSGVNILRSAAALYPEREEMKLIPHYVRFNRSCAGSLRTGMMAPDVPLSTLSGIHTSLAHHLDPNKTTLLIAGSMS